MTVPKAARVSAQTLKRVRDYAVAEPSFSVSFACWELGLSNMAVRSCVDALLTAGVVEQVEPRQGPYGAVYAYKPPEPTPRRNGRRFAELDDARVGELAPARGVIVPHTRIEGVSHSPGRDRARQERGVRLARGKGRGA